jgi:carbamoylphosphate synthase small subunit
LCARSGDARASNVQYHIARQGFAQPKCRQQEPRSDKHPEVQISHINLNDHSVEGIRVPAYNAFSVQYHPEAGPGPHDSHYLFDDFLKLVHQYAGSNAVMQ